MTFRSLSSASFFRWHSCWCAPFSGLSPTVSLARVRRYSKASPLSEALSSSFRCAEASRLQETLLNTRCVADACVSITQTLFTTVLLHQGPKQLLEQGYKKYGEVFTVPVLNKKITFLIGTDVTPFFFKATDEEMSQQEVHLQALQQDVSRATPKSLINYCCCRCTSSMCPHLERVWCLTWTARSEQNSSSFLRLLCSQAS